MRRATGREGKKERDRKIEHFYKPVTACEREIKRKNKKQRAGVSLGA